MTQLDQVLRLPDERLAAAERFGVEQQQEDRRARQLRDGVELYPTILPALEAWSTRLSVPAPNRI